MLMIGGTWRKRRKRKYVSDWREQRGESEPYIEKVTNLFFPKSECRGEEPLPSFFITRLVYGAQFNNFFDSVALALTFDPLWHKLGFNNTLHIVWSPQTIFLLHFFFS